MSGAESHVALTRAARFATSAPVATATRFGSGHVNDTFLVTDENGRRYILQRVGPPAFRQPEHVMANILAVTQAMASQVADPRRRLALVPTRDDAWWVPEPTGECWRLYDYIDGSCELSAPLTSDEFAAVGRAFGDFMVQVSGIDATTLHITIPHYHDEPRYVARLKAVAAADPLGRVAQVREDIERVLAYETISHDFDDTDMPARVTHNDAKVANVLFDAATRQPLCVVDLDTVQPGLAVNDFGDMVRSGAATAPEDEPDLDRVHFSPELFEACVRGYVGASRGILTASELANLRQGARIMTLETSLRFLIDHIEGDVYYHIRYPGQNLDRARNQARLLGDIDAHWAWMGQAIEVAIRQQSGPAPAFEGS